MMKYLVLVLVISLIIGTVVPSYAFEIEILYTWDAVCEDELSNDIINLDDFLCMFDVSQMYDDIINLNSTVMRVSNIMVENIEYITILNNIVDENNKEIIRLNDTINEQKDDITFLNEATKMYIEHNLIDLIPYKPLSDNVENGNGTTTLTLKEYVQRLDVTNATHYVLKFNGIVSEHPLDTKIFTFNDLENEVRHDGEILAVNIFGESNSMNFALFPTEPPHMPDPPVISVELRNVWYTEIGVSIDADNGNSTIIDYVAEISTDGVKWEKYDHIFNISGVTIKGLINGQEYHIRIATVTEIGTSGFSNVISATPAGIPIPENFIASKIGSDYVVLTWDIVDFGGVELLGHRIEYYSNNDYINPIIIEHDTTTTIRINDLIPNTEYVFRLFPYNIMGEVDDEDIPRIVITTFR